MQSASRSGADPALRPHPALTEYYSDEPGRRRRVDAWFNASAGHYDWINTLMSFGSGRWYRRDALRRLGVSAGDALLDVGSGTGVLALHAQALTGERGLVIALDPSTGMLAQAARSGVRRCVPGYAERLPFPDAQFDYLTMGYALRHVTDLTQTFAEYRRVLKPGGKLLLLEITRPRSRFGMLALRCYMKGIVPALTRLLRGSSEAAELMRYYWDTIEHCVPPQTILDALRDAGFDAPQREVLFGTLSEYVARRPGG